MKQKSLLTKMMLLFLVILGATTVSAQRDYSSVYTTGTGFTLPNTGQVTVKIGDDSYNGYKLGSSNSAGSMNITVPKDTKYLHLHIAGWKGETVTLTMKKGSTTITTIELTADAGINGTGTTYTLDASKCPTDYYKVVTLSSALTAATEYTLTATSGKRFVIWGINAEPLPTSVTLKRGESEVSSINMMLGDEDVTLSSSVAPATANQTVTWYSDNTSVATVTNGVVHAVAAGNATITATSTLNTVFATCDVTVNEATSPIATVSVTELAFGEVEVGQNKDMTFTVTPANLTGDLTIASNNAKYTVSPNSIAQATTAATTITVTAAPTALADDMDGTITISGGGITSKTVSLSATPYMNAAVSLVADPVNKGTFTYNSTSVTSIDSRVGESATITAVPETGYKFAGWTASGATPASSSNAEQEFTFTGASPILTAAFEIDNSITYDFSKINDLSDWGTTYSKHTITYDDATVVFASANKQTSTITDVPVTKGGDVTLTLKNEGETLKSVKFVCKQWGTKAQTITLWYSTDGGVNFSKLNPSVTSTNFTIESNNLPKGTNAVKITFSSSSNQVGIASATIDITRVVKAVVTNANYATFVSDKALDFSETDITVYTATDGETSVALNEVASGKIPANTPVVLYKENADGTNIFVPIITSASAVGDNDLRVSTGTDVNNMYVLAKKDNGVGFYPWGGTNLSAGKVYLQGKSSYGARSFIGFGDETASVKEKVTVNSDKLSTTIYDLQGRRVIQPTKGVYLINGKKIVVK